MGGVGGNALVVLLTYDSGPSQEVAAARSESRKPSAGFSRVTEVAFPA
jgi:hypothetical protein